MISHFSFWNYLKLAMSKSPIPIHIFFLILPLMCPILSTSSKHLTKTLPLPSILRARPYYRPSSAYFIKRSLLTGPECFPFLQFLPPLPLFFGIPTNNNQIINYDRILINLCVYKLFHAIIADLQFQSFRMSKTSGKQILKTVTEEIKLKTSLYPYYNVSAKFEQNGNFFVFSVEYPGSVASISFFMIKKDLSKKIGVTSIQLAGINDKSAISIIQIIDFKFKETPYNVCGLEGTILVGYREGHLVIIKFKDKKTEVVHKFNKLIKKQGLMHKATSFLSAEQSYKTLLYGPIKTALYSPSKKYTVSFLVGNNLVLYKNKEQVCQQAIQKVYKASFQDQKSVRIVLDEGILYRVQNVQMCTFSYTERQQILIAFSMEAVISCYSSKDFSIIYSIRMTMPIRKISYFSFTEGQFLSIMPYEDYVILVDLTKSRYSKITGHRCFTANSVIYKNQFNSLVLLSGGMDHRICFDKLEDIKGWHSLSSSKISGQKNIVLQNSKNILQIDQDKNGVQFSNKYSLGEYQNARTNSHDYGFSDLIIGPNLMAFPTYDGKIKVFNINYK